MAQLRGYAELAVNLLREYLDVDLSANLIMPEPAVPASIEPVIDSVELEIATGRYRLERLKSHATDCMLNTGLLVTPVKLLPAKNYRRISLPSIY
jgi:hypothetical protein